MDQGLLEPNKIRPADDRFEGDATIIALERSMNPVAHPIELSRLLETNFIPTQLRMCLKQIALLPF